jgi:hypothetical protein
MAPLKFAPLKVELMITTEPSNALVRFAPFERGDLDRARVHEGVGEVRAVEQGAAQVRRVEQSAGEVRRVGAATTP